MTVNIYCLLDPRSNKPFYVGCTNGKLSTRLSAHITEIKTYTGNRRSKKQEYIAEMIEQGIRPTILLLCLSDLEVADHCEEFYYLAFKRAGFELLQLPSSFFYSRKIKQESANYQSFINNCTNVAKINA